MIRTLFALLGAAFLLVAPPAHADDASYLAALQAQGVPTGPGFTPMTAGYNICMSLRAGMKPADAALNFGWMNAWGPVFVDAAQHNLCPDTLH
jgi:hypothetical protein